MIAGGAALVWPDLPGSLGRPAVALAVAWGILLVAVAERGRRAGVGAPRGKERAR